MTYKVIMHIPYTRVDVVNTQLGMIGYDIRDQYGNQKNEAIFDEDIGFDNGFYMSIYAMPNEDKKPVVETDLYDDEGCLCASVALHKTAIDDTYEFSYNGDDYIVELDSVA